MDHRKEAICNALAAFVRQRPGLEWCNYATSNHAESCRAYRADQRTAQRQKRDAESLLLAVRHNPGITADMMLAAADGRGRLEIKEGSQARSNETTRHGGAFRVDWTPGQYWCLEFRAGVARYLASMLWDFARTERMGEGPDRHSYIGQDGRVQMLTGGELLRKFFRQQFGSALQKRYFD